MAKAILTFFFKLSYLTKSIFAFILGLFDDLIKYFDEIGLYILHSFRSIRIDEVRDYISENFFTIILFIVLLFLIYSTIINKKKHE